MFSRDNTILLCSQPHPLFKNWKLGLGKMLSASSVTGQHCAPGILDTRDRLCVCVWLFFSYLLFQNKWHCIHITLYLCKHIWGLIPRSRNARTDGMCIFNSHFSCQITFHGSCSSLPTNNTAWQVLNQLGPNCPLWPLMMPGLAGPVPFGLAVVCHVQCCSETDIAEASQRMGTCFRAPASTTQHYTGHVSASLIRGSKMFGGRITP